jgi:transcription initiation factor TFIIIB Brf1 subunit/transcription initiation factor TFIIB
VTQKRVADAAGVSTVSMRNRLRELEVFYGWD